ncbi:twin-arginine translocase TatA/TatE family subunit [Aquiluna sp. KACHI24]|uniref:twin-arginine translocase TatA/TatE family subunit n=1 Tax=Aquiluna sp. KACHI24 TaxID=2968831 RepID=UPI00220ECE63|nr:twin-arginine translocase TatA/TatE family subunit [Aquiluna sp. KACHI24]BDQ00013.1 translocase [Aquiluna sp. KACHI24]
MFGLSAEKFLLLVVLAVIILGPDRLPYYAKKLGELVRKAKRMIDGAQEQMKTELGGDFEDMDWKKLDPRQYDPRRIVREALLEEKREQRNIAQQLNRPKPVHKPLEIGEAAPFDADAT